MALKHKNDLAVLQMAQLPGFQIIQGKSIGDLLTIKHVSEELGISSALGSSFQGKLALWQVMARIIGQGSRLSSVRLASKECDVSSVLKLKRGFDENDLYENLAWLADNQTKIEDDLFQKRYADGRKPSIFLYDVTSSYLEGTHNELAEFGYNRDKKKGKKQIVIGLLCDEEGNPLSTQVFKGNTQDPATVSEQVKKIAQRFGCTDVTFVGDKGMIKKGQIDTLQKQGFHYITSITKPQIKKLLADGLFKMELFDITICEIAESNTRYILRKNPVRAREMQRIREEKLERIKNAIDEENEYLKNHSKADPEKALNRVSNKIKRYKCLSWLTVTRNERLLALFLNSEAMEEDAKLDGCYAIKTDLGTGKMNAQAIHDRYKDLALVEWAFRTEKTTHLELRPVYVRREKSTYGHVFTVMLSYLIVRHLAKHWEKINLKVEEGIRLLSKLCTQELHIMGREAQTYIPTPVNREKQLLESIGLTLPKTLKKVEVPIKTRKTVRKAARCE
ncbi:IS1634 family transposase [Candidatus Dependentiae bacterium]|nr:IS1634 family transposase [Candidatus Dependentiae bacterium]